MVSSQSPLRPTAIRHSGVYASTTQVIQLKRSSRYEYHVTQHRNRLFGVGGRFLILKRRNYEQVYQGGN